MHSLLEYLNATTIGVFVILLFSCYYLLTKSNSNSGQKPPEASGKWPVIGHLRLLSGNQLPHHALGALADKHGPVFTIRVGVHPALVVSSWEVAKELFTKYDVDISCRPQATYKDLFYNYASFVFSPYSPYWREIRKITNLHLLSNRRLELLKQVRADEVENGIKEIYKLWTNKNKESNHVLIEMKKWFGDLNLNLILRMLAGKRWLGEHAESDEKEMRRCRTVIRDFLNFVGIFVVRDAFPFLGWLDIGGHEKAMKKTAKELDSLLQEWIEEHRKKRDSGDEAVAKEQDFMDELLSVLNGIDLSDYDVDTVVKATIVSIISGASDTLTVHLSWAISLLLNDPHVLRKVKEELDNVVGRERLLNESDIDKLVYFPAVVKETLRLYPPGPLSGTRQFTEDCNVAGYHVAKGTRLLLNLWKLHTDPRVWSDPLEFKPERFLTTHKDVDVKGQHFELLPFGSGRRVCPGISYALHLSHLALASLLHAFDMSTPSSTPVDMTETSGLTNVRASALEILMKPRLSSNLYE